MFLARDRVGKKPLFYAQTHGQFVFASELQALVQPTCLRSTSFDLGAIDDYLSFGYIPAPRTAFEGIQKLPPSHYLTLTVAGDGTAAIETKRYWQLRFTPKLNMSEEEAIEGLL